MKIEFTKAQRFDAFLTDIEKWDKQSFSAEYGIPLDMFYTQTGNVLVYAYGLYIEILDNGYFMVIDKQEYLSNDLPALQKLLFESLSK